MPGAVADPTDGGCACPTDDMHRIHHTKACLEQVAAEGIRLRREIEDRARLMNAPRCQGCDDLRAHLAAAREEIVEYQKEREVMLRYQRMAVRASLRRKGYAKRWKAVARELYRRVDLVRSALHTTIDSENAARAEAARYRAALEAVVIGGCAMGPRGAICCEPRRPWPRARNYHHTPECVVSIARRALGPGGET